MVRQLKLLLGLLAFGFTGTASASYVSATWEDNYDVGTGILISDGDSYEYFHDLTLDGFNVGQDLVTDFLLSIDLYDDGDWKLEVASVDLPGLLSDRWVSSFNFGEGAYEGGWSIIGLIELNLLGSLTVTISSLYGDFIFGGSDLVAHGYTRGGTQSVPEPGTLGMLGVGLLGIALAARRRKGPRS